MNINNYSISSRIIGCFAIVGLTLAAVIGFVTSRMDEIDDRYSALIEKDATATVATARAQGRLYNFGQVAWRIIAAADSPEIVKQLVVELQDNEKELDTFLAKAQSLAPQYTTRIQAIRKQHADTLNYFADIEKAALTRDVNIVQMLAGNLTTYNKKTRDLVRSLMEDMERETKVHSDRATADTHAAIYITIAAAIVALLSSSALAFAIVKLTVVNPIRSMSSNMTTIANGNLEANVGFENREDEVGLMAKAVRVFKDTGLKARDLEREAQAQRDATEKERLQVEAERAEKARQQSTVVEGLAMGLACLAKKDLTHRLSGFSADYKKLEIDFNAAMSELGAALDVVRSSANSISASTQSVSASADDLSRRTEQQAASLEETAAALHEITNAGKSAADGAKHARDVVADAHSNAKQAGDVVKRTVESMGDIEKSSQEIGQIIGVIDEIAFQTNLLALNAGVEAARAGDAGRGFAVVASEVRALAQRSAEAAKQIKELILTSSAQVENGVRLVADTGAALERIVEQVSDINNAVVDIASNAEGQATGLQQVQSAINQMDQVTQQNAAMVEESTAGSHELSRETQLLSQIIGEFKLNHTSGGQVVTFGSHNSNARPAEKSKEKRPEGRVKRVSGSKHTEYIAPSNNSDWTEF